jgi:LPXTG-motif cell wall-anchored protein
VNASLVLGITFMALCAPASGQAPVMISIAGLLLVLTGTWLLTKRHTKGT